MIDAPSMKSTKSPTLPPGGLLHMDIMSFEYKSLFLVTTDDATGFILESKLKNKTKGQVARMARYHVNFFKTQGWIPKRVSTDKEAVFQACQHSLAEVQVDWVHSPAYQHEPIVERSIRSLSETARCVHAAQLYPIVLETEKYLVNYSAQCNNIVPNIKTGPTMSPFSIIMRRTPTYAECRPVYGNSVIFYHDSASRDRAKQVVSNDDTLGVLPPHSPHSKLNSSGEHGFIVGRDFSSTRPSIMVYNLRTRTVMNVTKYVVVQQRPEHIAIMVERKIQEVAERASNPVSESVDYDVDVDDDSSQASSDEQFNVEAVIKHKGVFKKGTLEFLVQFEGYPEPEWLSYRKAKELSALDEYIANKAPKLKFLNEKPILKSSRQVVKVLRSYFETHDIPSLSQRVSKVVTNDVFSVFRMEMLYGEMDVASVDKLKAGGDNIQRDLLSSIVQDKNEFDLGGCQPLDDNELAEQVFHIYDIELPIFQLTIAEATLKYGKALVDKAVLAEVDNLINFNTLLYDKKFFKTLLPAGIHLEEKIKPLLAGDDLSPQVPTLKCRMTAGGHRQPKSMSMDASSPTVNATNINILLNIAAFEGLDISTADVPSAYLQCSMEGLKDQYGLQIPARFSSLIVDKYPRFQTCLDEKTGMLRVGLGKALYGLKEASKLWYLQLKDDLISQGFRMSDIDRCIFEKHVDGKKMFIAIHVDDLLIITNDVCLKESLISKLQHRYGKLKLQEGVEVSYLGVRIRHDKESKTITIDQIAYITGILEEYKNIDTIVATPSLPSFFEEAVNKTPVEKFSFMSMLMKLMYLAKRTRADILKEVCYLSTKGQTPVISDQHKLDRVLSYLRGTWSLMTTFSPTSLIPHLYVDASSTTHVDMKGHTGCVMMMSPRGGPMWVASVKQKLVSKSTTEAELIALDYPISQLMAVKYLLNDLGYTCDPMIVYQDNKSTIKMTEKGYDCGSNTKHIMVRYFYIKERIENGDINVCYLPTEDMIADLLTKPLTGKLFLRLRNLMLNINSV